MKIQVKNVSKLFGPHPRAALKALAEGVGKDEIMKKHHTAVGVADVSFDVQEGEILVIMGLSGSGKSTLLRCLNRLITPTSGQIIVDGHDLMKLNPEELRQLRMTLFGMVFQRFALLPHRTVQKNVEYGLEIQNIPADIRAEKAKNALALVGLSGWEDYYPENLSGGMQQRVGLARALAIEPDILLMDEAFSALDPLIKREMQDELLALQSRVNKTIIFITHDLDEALKIGDRIILMKDGKIVQIGTPEEILTNPATRYVEKFVEGVDISRVLTVRSVMRKPLSITFPKDGPKTALHEMEDEGVSALFVVDKKRHPIGLIDVDSATRAQDEKATTLDGYIDTNLTVVHADVTIGDLFPEKRYPIAVVNDDGMLIGVVKRGSLLAGLAGRRG